MLFKGKDRPGTPPAHEARGRDTIYTGNLCGKCHDRAMTRTFILSSFYAAFGFGMVALDEGLGGRKPMRDWGARFGATVTEGTHGVVTGTARIANEVARNFHRHPFGSVEFISFFAAIVAIPCFLNWAVWQWKLAQHGLPSKLGWLYTRSAKQRRYLKFWDRHTELQAPAPVEQRPVPGPGGKVTP